MQTEDVLNISILMGHVKNVEVEDNHGNGVIRLICLLGIMDEETREDDSTVSIKEVSLVHEVKIKVRVFQVEVLLGGIVIFPIGNPVVSR